MSDLHYRMPSRERIILGGESDRTGVIGLFVAAAIGVAIAAYGFKETPEPVAHKPVAVQGKIKTLSAAPK